MVLESSYAWTRTTHNSEKNNQNDVQKWFSGNISVLNIAIIAIM